MSCAACSARVDKAVRSLKGVKEVNVNLLTNSMLVSYSEEITSEDIISAVTKAGYGASLINETKEKKTTVKEDFVDRETPKLVRRLIISLIILIPLFYLGMGFMFNWPLGYLRENVLVLALIEMVLALAIMIINRKFFISGTKAVFHGGPNMDTLVALGSGVAFIYSFIMMFFLFNHAMMDADLATRQEMMNMTMMNISFETAGMVPTLITVGKTLESYSKGKTTSAIKSLLDLAPKTANVIRNDVEVTINLDEVVLGDIFIVRPGESIPVDGEIIAGESSVDESALTGESMPLDKNIGNLVKSATINKNGVLTCKAVRVGDETTLNQIIKMVETAAGTKAKISSIADKVSGIFVPVVIGIALIVFVGWMIFGESFLSSHSDISSTLLSYSIERGIAVLVISCPCALGLATPVAIMVGSGKGAKNGILFKNASSIEETGKIDFIIFDKTGTITKGEPTVSDIELIDAEDENELLEIAYSLEFSSEHPLSLAIKELAKQRGITNKEVSNFMAISGKGIKANIGKDAYLAGNLKLINENNISNERLEGIIDKFSNQGKTPLIFAKNKQILGIIAVSDVVKEDSKQAIELIKGLGIIPIMLTGDNKKAAQYVANQVGIDYVISDVLPEGKLDIINKVKEYGKVAMVGDGINDAAGLTAADIGIAIGQGSDIAIESASVVLMKSTLMDAYGAIRLSQQTLLNIKENLFWAFFYNLIMIPIAAGALSGVGLYKVAPWMGSAAMALSSVFVVTNALRLNLFNVYKPKHRNKKVNIPDILTKEYQPCEIARKEETQMGKEIKIEGMMCMHCVAYVKEALEKVPGVSKVEVSLENKNAIVEGDAKNEDLIKAVVDAGYKAEM